MKLVGYARLCVGRVVDHEGEEETLVARHQVRSIRGQFPFESKVTLAARLRVGRDHGNKERALPDLPPNALVPLVAAPQFALVKPHLDARGPEGFADAPRRLRVLGGVTEEDGFAGVAHQSLGAISFLNSESSRNESKARSKEMKTGVKKSRCTTQRAIEACSRSTAAVLLPSTAWMRASMNSA